MTDVTGDVRPRHWILAARNGLHLGLSMFRYSTPVTGQVVVYCIADSPTRFFSRPIGSPATIYTKRRLCRAQTHV
jgi:hypothetical protein